MSKDVNNALMKLLIDIHGMIEEGEVKTFVFGAEMGNRYHLSAGGSVIGEGGLLKALDINCDKRLIHQVEKAGGLF